MTTPRGSLQEPLHMLEDGQEPAQTIRNATSPSQERLLFLRRCLAHPLRVAAVLPSPPELGRLIAEAIPDPGPRFVLEIGVGTGTVSRELLRRIPEEQLLLVEVDDEMCQWLRRRFPRATVLHGNALELDRVLPAECRNGNIAAVVSGIPVVHFSTSSKRIFVERTFDAMSGKGPLLQYTYLPVPPLPRRAFDIEATRAGMVFGALAPLFLWRFTRRPR